MAKNKCGRVDCGCERKNRAFGTATWLVVLAAVAVVGAALWFTLKSHHAASQAQNVATWHPEPSFLLQHQAELKLQPRQLRHIQIAARVWSLKRAAFDVQFKTYNTDSQAALDDLSSNKPASGEYGKLLSSFEKARATAWANTAATLTPEQVVALDGIRERALNPRAGDQGIGNR